MSNEIKKPTNEASEVSVAKYLIQQFPEWKEQLKKLVYAYEMPYKYFCEREAEFRLESLGISTTTFDYPSMVELIAEDLFKSDTFSDGEIAEQIASSVLKEDFCLDLKDEKQIAFLKENYFKSELLLALTGSKANLPFLASYVCELNTKKTNRKMEEAFWNVLDSREKDYITTKELQELFLTFQKEYRDNQTRILNTSKKLLKDCKIGEIVTDNIGVKWIVIKHNEDGTTKLWRKELLPDSRRFDKESNNFNGSEIQKFLNAEYIKYVEEGFGKENLCIQEVDLTSLDGLTTYGTCECPIRLGGIDDYRNARKQGLFREKNNNPFWLDTPYSTNLEGYNASDVQVVDYCGNVFCDDCGWYDCSVRPFISLKSDILVSSEVKKSI